MKGEELRKMEGERLMEMKGEKLNIHLIGFITLPLGCS